MLRGNRESIIRGDMDGMDAMDTMDNCTLSIQSILSISSINYSKAIANTIISTKPDNNPTVGISVPRR